MIGFSLKAAFLLMFVTCSNVYAQDVEESMIKVNLEDHITINELPSQGNFITVQVAFASIEAFKYDYNMLAAFAVLSPVFYKDGGYFSIGIFNDIDKASELSNKLSCILYDPLAVAYNNGKRISLYKFKGGNWEEDIPNVEESLKKLKKLLKGTYYRMRIGYYEKEGFTPDEQAVYDKLKENGISVKEQKYKNGRIYVTKKKLKTYSEAKAFQQKIANLIGSSHVQPEIYCDFKKIYLEYLHKVNDCLSASK